MRNEGPSCLYGSRKQLVMVVTYRSSVTLPVWAVSHQACTTVKPGPRSPTIHLSPKSPSLSGVHAFCFLLWPFSPLSFPHLTLTTPTSSTSALFPISVEDVCQKTSAVTRHSCPDSKPAHLSLLCRNTPSLSLTFSYKTVLGRRPIKAPRWRPLARRLKESDGVWVLVKVTGLKLE